MAARHRVPNSSHESRSDASRVARRLHAASRGPVSATCNRCATPVHDRGRHDNPTTHRSSTSPDRRRRPVHRGRSRRLRVGRRNDPVGRVVRPPHLREVDRREPGDLRRRRRRRGTGAAHDGSEPRPLPGVHPRRNGDRLLQRSFRVVRDLDDEHRRNGPATDHPRRADGCSFRRSRPTAP